MGLSFAGGTTSIIKLLGYAKKIPITILYSGSIHSFIDPRVVKMLKLLVHPIIVPLRDVVANGHIMRCDKESPMFN